MLCPLILSGFSDFRLAGKKTGGLARLNEQPEGTCELASLLLATAEPGSVAGLAGVDGALAREDGTVARAGVDGPLAGADEDGLVALVGIDFALAHAVWTVP